MPCSRANCFILSCEFIFLVRPLSAPHWSVPIISTGNSAALASAGVVPFCRSTPSSSRAGCPVSLANSSPSLRLRTTHTHISRTADLMSSPSQSGKTARAAGGIWRAGNFSASVVRVGDTNAGSCEELRPSMRSRASTLFAMSRYWPMILCFSLLAGTK